MGSFGAVVGRLAQLGPRQVLIPFVDASVAAAAWSFVYAARFDFAVPSDQRGRLLTSMLVVVLVQSSANYARHLARAVWSTSGIRDLVLLGQAAALAAAIYVPLLLLIYRPGSIPRSVFVLAPPAIVALSAVARVAYRSTMSRQRLRATHPSRIFAVGDKGTLRTLAAELALDPSIDLVGLFDATSTYIGRAINGTPVLGSTDELGGAIAANRVEAVVLGLSSRDADVARVVAMHCADADIAMHFVPPQGTRRLGVSLLQELRELRLEDLLERNTQSVLEASEIREALHGKRVLVTGGGGSIGFELVRQIAALGPGSLVLFDSSEFNVYRALERLEADFPQQPVEVVLGDVADETLVDQVFRRHLPQVVFHAAAYKHVPILETQVGAAVRANLFGTRAVANAAHQHGAERFVLISSDKAVRPSSVMGCTKRLAELALGAVSSRSATIFLSVRFGNVLDSSGSVVPRFRQQIENGGPVTVTDPDITRFFMTIPEASELILYGLAVGAKDDILVLDMGEPIRIMDLAAQMVRLSGRSRDEVEIVVTGLRPGEKLHEELFYEHETLRPTAHERILRATHVPVDKEWLDVTIEALARHLANRDEKSLRELIDACITRLGSTAGEFVVELRTPATGWPETLEMAHD